MMICKYQQQILGGLKFQIDDQVINQTMLKKLYSEAAEFILRGKRLKNISIKTS